ncbi:TonB-dependent receptor [Pedobacter rhizosphaerae]|uniref:Outer membrane receptor for ferrienterochelin and colicins n=1 Tax=Pedobacter rhizosphaerae TaxID=390241 RepID=A0A1H9P4F3_9SPHI|nr:TonB-dependent receptor [Pedobacter rhizosphaerae]SER43080.1 Outer membrane receptor for ferrienterochelin and colicins [Pedobacter rhizosphaerae]
MRYKNIFILLFILFSSNLFAQNNGIITGTVQNANTSELLSNVNISINDSLIRTQTDSSGKFRISVPVGSYKVSANYVGYSGITKYNIVVGSGNPQVLSFDLQPLANNLGDVVISFNRKKSAIATDMVTPLSVQQLTTEEIKSNPGGNFDVSKVIQTLPGVGISNGVGERNDVIVRGGAPNENVYYLDGIEIPLLNHFQTQGSSGGAQGILNVSFIESLKLTSSAFDARYDNPLASTFVIKQREGNAERIAGNARVSLTESVLTLEGPISNKTTFLASGRKSYLGLLFGLIDLPIRPNFYDFQYKVVHKFNDKTTLTAIGLGAIDRFNFAATKESTPENIYTLRSTPYINQWSYTAGFTLNRKIENGFMNFTVSRNVFDNSLDKYEDERQNESTRTLSVASQEVENKFRFDINKFVNGWKLSTGLMAQEVGYTSNLYNKLSAQINDANGNLISPEQVINFNSDINFWKFGLFMQASKNLFNDKLLVSGGIRSDVNTFTDNGNNPLKTLSPRLSLAYHINAKWDISGSVGSYFKIPTYTALGYVDQNRALVNQTMDYIRSDHYVIGTQFLPRNDLRFTLESFYKRYSNYPVSTTSGISLANQGAEYGSVGSEQLLSIGKGETFGFEVFMQQKLISKFFYVASYSWLRSKFSGLNGVLIPSSWDSQHLLSLALGYKLKANWDLGLKYRYAGGSPYTPFDLQASQQNYVTLGTGTLDYQNLNTERLAAFSQLDFRVDKRVNFKRTSFNFYIDIQNILMRKNASLPKYTFKRNADNSAFATTDGQPLRTDGTNGIPTILNTDSGNVIPSIGAIFEF